MMNERNKELYQMAVKSASAELHEWNKNWQPSSPNFEYEKVLYKKFAELIVREVLSVQEQFIAEGHNAWHLNKPTKEHFGVE
jgi:hypothetical protein